MVTTVRGEPLPFRVDLEALEATPRAFQALGYRRGGGVCFAALGSWTVLLRKGTVPPRLRRRLCRHLADLHNLLAWTEFDAGHNESALRPFDVAVEIVIRTGSSDAVTPALVSRKVPSARGDGTPGACDNSVPGALVEAGGLGVDDVGSPHQAYLLIGGGPLWADRYPGGAGVLVAQTAPRDSADVLTPQRCRAHLRPGPTDAAAVANEPAERVSTAVTRGPGPVRVVRPA